ncbi:2-oxo-4-hydroxy-4-carboxy-5-ureidoimidazoline decarboxylase (plasmid) [Coraliomargarita sp. W4R53]
MHIDEFNNMDAADARELAMVWAAIMPWADELVSARPYASAAELEGFAALRAAAWTRADLGAALEQHPRIGEKPQGSGAEAAASRLEQSSMADAASDVAARITAGNVAYEQRFGRVFLIRAAGRTPAELLADLERRLNNDEQTEAAEATEQLAEIALLRLHAAVTDSPTEPAEDLS